MSSQAPTRRRSPWPGLLLAFVVTTLLTLVFGGSAYVHFYPALE